MGNLPPCGYSWGLQRLTVMCCRSGAHEQITTAGSAELAVALADLRRIANTGTARLGRLGLDLA